MSGKPQKRVLLYLASFALPFALIVVSLLWLQVVPFGDKTLVISDANGLYINYLSYAGRLYEGLEGIVYSFEKGLGGNMMPHIAGTMSNPTFALFCVFDILNYPAAFTWVSTLNLSICGLTMYIFLADVFGHKASNLIFSTSYALSGFMVANVFQVIFFTGPQALPIMVLGLRKIFQGKNPLAYMLALAYAAATSFYFGFTLAVASLLMFLALMWAKWHELEGRRLSVFINYAVSSLCGGFLAACLWLPAFMGLMGGRLNQTTIADFSFSENMPLLDILTKLFTGSNNRAQLVDGLPNIFVGLLPVALVVLFFMNKDVDKRMKTAAGFLLGFYLICFYVVAFDMLMHGGTSTNWFNHRYSYIFSFFLLCIAAYEWKLVESVSFSDLKRCFIGLVVVAMVVFSKSYEYVMAGEVLLDFALLLVVFLAFRIHRLRPQFNPWRTFEAVTVLVVSLSLTFNYAICTGNIMEWGIKASDYQKTVGAVWPMIDGAKQADSSFYRMEVNNQRSQTTGNDPMLYGYDGVGHGGSNERNFVREELNKLGVQWFDMRNYYAQGIPAATDALLGVKYLVADEDMTEEKDYTRITDVKAVGLAVEGAAYDLFKSEYALPVAFVSDDAIDDIELTRDDVFDNLNRVWSAVSNTNQNVFVEEDNISFKSANLSDSLEMDADEARGIVAKYEGESGDTATGMVDGGLSNRSDQNAAASQTTKSSDSTASGSESDDITTIHTVMDEAPQFAASVEFSFIAKQDGPVYVYHRAALSDSNGSAEPTIKYMGWHNKGDIVTGYLPVQGDYVTRVAFEEFSGRFRAAYANLDALKTMSNTVRERPSTVEKIKDDHLQGTVTVGEGQELLFTIPWDEGWTCRVDGQEVTLSKVLGVFMAADIAPGEHTYEMTYEPAGLRVGAGLSIGALVVMLFYLLVGRRLIGKTTRKQIEISSEAESLPESSAIVDVAQADTEDDESV